MFTTCGAIRRKAHHAIQLYHREGVVQLVRAVVHYARRGFWIPAYQAQRVDIEQRWSMIEPHVPDDASTVLDIGCAEGALTRKFAERGLVAVGVDEDEVKIKRALDTSNHLDTIAFHHLVVTPDVVSQLPTFDICLLMTVYGWWIRYYGKDEAERMLQDLWSRCDIMFFEGHGSTLGVKDTDIREMTPASYHEYFGAILPEARVGYLGEATYKGDERTDPVFVLS